MSKKLLFLLPLATLALVGCPKPAEGGNGGTTTSEEPAKFVPKEGVNYHLAIVQEGIEGSPTLYLKDVVPEKNPWYLMSSQNVAEAATVTVHYTGETFTIQVGSHYLQHTLSNNKLSNFLVEAASATAYSWDAEREQFYATVNNKDGDPKQVTTGTYSTYASFSSQYLDSTTTYFAKFVAA